MQFGGNGSQQVVAEVFVCHDSLPSFSRPGKSLSLIQAQNGALMGDRATQAAAVLGATLQQLRQLGDVRGDAPGLVAGEQLGRRPPCRLLLEIDVGERLPVGVADDEAGVGLLDGPGRREAALGQPS
jgi:hypothetical protein